MKVYTYKGFKYFTLGVMNLYNIKVSLCKFNYLHFSTISLIEIHLNTQYLCQILLLNLPVGIPE